MNIEYIINQKKTQVQKTRYRKFGLSANPFPKSGTANIYEPIDTTYSLKPIEDKTTEQIAQYVADSLYSEDCSENYRLTGIITGDHGTGKTQLLLFARALILKQEKKAYVVYISNPGTKLSELIGTIVEDIGQEQFKKYLWAQVIEEIETNRPYKEALLNFISSIAIFGNKDPFSEENHATYHLFIDSFLSQIDSEVKIRKFNQSLKEIMIQIFTEKNNNDKVIATYFYDLISEDVGICNAWETLISGNGQYLDNKAATILNVIISIVRHQGFERFYVLIDEFEDLTSGRLTKKEVDDYTYNLRTLIDKERRWCILITLTSRALHELKNISPPLVERLTDRIIKINRLSNEEAMKLIQNHLHLVKKDNDDSLYPFTRESITYLNNGAKGLPRLFLRQSYSVLEKAIEVINGDEMITAEFVRLSR